MILITFLKNVNSKPINYVNVWSFLLSRIEIEQNSSVSIFEISAKFKIPIKTLYRILNYGFEFLQENDFDYLYFLEKNNVKIFYKKNLEPDFIDKINSKKSKNKQVKSKGVKIDPKVQNKPKNKASVSKNKNLDVVDLILGYLNQKTNKNFSSINISTVKLINSRITEGFELENFYYVIDIKTDQWLNTKYENSLRPQTLFGPNMESYLNEKNKSQKTNYLQKNYESASKAVSHFTDDTK
jgi:uncharacterized phage protein (TIGR02220 family)